jgi:TonB family protein
MNLRLMSICALVPVFAATGVRVEASPQNVGGGDSSQSEVVMTKLVEPVYPPLAWQAHITGDVELTVNVRPDGRVGSVGVVSGHPLLVQAARDSAQNSQYECRKCDAPETSYRLNYTFQLGDSAVSGTTLRRCVSASDVHQSGSLVIESENQVTLVAQPLCVFIDPADVHQEVRAMKCLYLWKCGRNGV